MLKALRPIFLISVGLAFSFASSALTPSNLPNSRINSFTTFTQITYTSTPTATVVAEKVPGDTNIILLLGVFLVIIIITAILWHRRDWER